MMKIIESNLLENCETGKRKDRHVIQVGEIWGKVRNKKHYGDY
jgi:hypothetical protein